MLVSKLKSIVIFILPELNLALDSDVTTAVNPQKNIASQKLPLNGTPITPKDNENTCQSAFRSVQKTIPTP